MSHVPEMELPDQASATSNSDRIELEGLPEDVHWIFKTQVSLEIFSQKIS